MAKFNELLKTDPNKAAGIVQDGFLHIVNTMIPEVYMNKKEWHDVVKIILAGKATCDHDFKEESDEGTEPTTPTDPSTETE